MTRSKQNRKKEPQSREEMLQSILLEGGVLPGSAEYEEFLRLDEYQQRIFILKYYQKNHEHSEYAYSVGETECNMEGVRAENARQFTPSAMARSSLLYLQSAAVMHTPATHYTRRKNFASYLLLETLSGEGTVTCAGLTKQLFPGDIILLDCRTEQYYAAAGTKWSYRILHFNGISMSALYQIIVQKQNFYFEASVSGEVHTLIDKIYACCLTGMENMELICNQLLVECVTSLLLLCPDRRKEQPEWITAICKYLDNDFQPNILERLEKKFFRSRYYIAHTFKEHTGQTVLQYQTNARMNAATHMLLDTALTIEEIAIVIGYENASSFDKAFRRRFGISPGLYRRQANY